MPNSKSSTKRLRQSLDRRLRNRSVKAAVRTQIKKVTTALEAGDLEAAQSEFRLTQKKLDQAGAHKVIERHKVARLKSRLSGRIKAAKTAAASG